ncbi:CHAD domain-containing protein [Chromobacterium alticapitis]|nr:CHAD domain-containing protein [Chromobacterium alticapitis]
MLESLRHLSANVSGVLVGDDPECVHQARVALRRLRAAGQAFRPLIRGKGWRSVMAEARRLASVLGQLRDLDVLLLETLPQTGLADNGNRKAASLRRELERLRESARAQARAALCSPAFAAWCLSLLERMNQPSKARDGELGRRSGFAARSLSRSWRGVGGLAERWNELDADERHELRKRAKKLRYSVEFFSSLYPRKQVRRYLAPLLQAQQMLGEINDSRAASVLLRRCSENRPGLAAEAERLCRELARQGPFDGAGMAGALQALREAHPFWR